MSKLWTVTTDGPKPTPKLFSVDIQRETEKQITIDQHGLSAFHYRTLISLHSDLGHWCFRTPAEAWRRFRGECLIKIADAEKLLLQQRRLFHEAEAAEGSNADEM